MNPFLHPTVAQASRQACRGPGAAVPNAGAAACGKRASPRLFRPQARWAARTLQSMGLAVALAAAGAAGAVDVNVATVEQLQTVRGIGPKTAQIILEERRRGGPYDSLEDLSDRVKGIGAKKAAALQASGLKVGAAGSAAAPPADTGKRGAEPEPSRAKNSR